MNRDNLSAIAEKADDRNIRPIKNIDKINK